RVRKVGMGGGVDDGGEEGVADLPWLDAGPADGLANAQRRQLARGDVLEAAAVAADRRPRPAQDDDLPCVSHRTLSCDEVSARELQLFLGRSSFGAGREHAPAELPEPLPRIEICGGEGGDQHSSNKNRLWTKPTRSSVHRTRKAE